MLLIRLATKKINAAISGENLVKGVSMGSVVAKPPLSGLRGSNRFGSVPVWTMVLANIRAPMMMWFVISASEGCEPPWFGC